MKLILDCTPPGQHLCSICLPWVWSSLSWRPSKTGESNRPMPCRQWRHLGTGTYAELFEYGRTTPSPSGNLCNLSMTCPLSRCSAGSQSTRENSQFISDLGCKWSNKPGFQYWVYLYIFPSRYSTSSLFYQKFPLLWWADCAAMDTKIMPSLLLYDPGDWTWVWPCWYPRLWQDHRCSPKPAHRHHALTHKLRLYVLEASLQRCGEPARRGPEWGSLWSLNRGDHK